MKKSRLIGLVAAVTMVASSSHANPAAAGSAAIDASTVAGVQSSMGSVASSLAQMGASVSVVAVGSAAGNSLKTKVAAATAKSHVLSGTVQLISSTVNSANIELARILNSDGVTSGDMQKVKEIGDTLEASDVALRLTAMLGEGPALKLSTQEQRIEFANSGEVADWSQAQKEAYLAIANLNASGRVINANANLKDATIKSDAAEQKSEDLLNTALEAYEKGGSSPGEAALIAAKAHTQTDDANAISANMARLSRACSVTFSKAN